MLIQSLIIYKIIIKLFKMEESKIKLYKNGDLYKGRI